jgi:hypothetical protein
MEVELLVAAVLGEHGLARFIGIIPRHPLDVIHPILEATGGERGVRPVEEHRGRPAGVDGLPLLGRDTGAVVDWAVGAGSSLQAATSSAAARAR